MNKMVMIMVRVSVIIIIIMIMIISFEWISKCFDYFKSTNEQTLTLFWDFLFIYSSLYCLSSCHVYCVFCLVIVTNEVDSFSFSKCVLDFRFFLFGFFGITSFL